MSAQRPSGTKASLHRVVARAGAPQADDVPRVEELDVGGVEEHERTAQPVVARRRCAVVVDDECTASDHRGVLRSRAPLPTPGHRQPAVDDPGPAHRLREATGDRIRRPEDGARLLGFHERREQRRRVGDERAPAGRRVVAGELDERVEAGRHWHLRAAVLSRHPEPEHPGVGQAVDEVAGQRATLLDLLRAGPQLAGEGAGGVER